MRIFTFSFVILNPQVANLLPIGNQLVIFALIPLSPWDSDSLEQFITHIGQILLCGEEWGKKSYYPGKDKSKTVRSFIFGF